MKLGENKQRSISLGGTGTRGSLWKVITLGVEDIQERRYRLIRNLHGGGPGPSILEINPTSRKQCRKLGATEMAFNSHRELKVKQFRSRYTCQHVIGLAGTILQTTFSLYILELLDHLYIIELSVAFRFIEGYDI